MTMGEFLSYSIVSGLIMLSMLLAYRVFLARENQHGYNRGVLLMIYAVSFATLPVTSLLQKFTSATSGQTIAMDGLRIAETVTEPVSKPVWGTVLIWIFMAGMTVVTARTIITWARLMAVIRSGEKVRRDGYTLVLTDDERFAPFSWMRYIVISRADHDENSSAIATHEMKHIASHHWLDLLIAQAVCIINWFNPAAWLMRDELMLVHEYQADMAVIDSGYNPQQYQMLLIKKAVGTRFPSLANSLNHSKLKKRITMMYKEKSGAGRRLKALALVPMIALALGVASVPAVRAAVSTISSSDVSTGKGNENAPNPQALVFKVKALSNDGGKTTIKVIAEGAGNEITVSGGELYSCGKKYLSNGLQTTLKDGVANITATFPFISEFDNVSMSLVVNNRPVMIDFSSLSSFYHSAVAVQSPDVLPEYPGGEVAMMEAIMRKLTFPDPNRQWKKEADGLTIVGFTVGADGTMQDFKIQKSCGYEDLDACAIQAIKDGLTVKWKPGSSNGKPVAVSYALPIRFKQMK